MYNLFTSPQPADNMGSNVVTEDSVDVRAFTPGVPARKKRRVAPHATVLPRSAHELSRSPHLVAQCQDFEERRIGAGDEELMGTGPPSFLLRGCRCPGCGQSRGVLHPFRLVPQSAFHQYDGVRSRDEVGPKDQQGFFRMRRGEGAFGFPPLPPKPPHTCSEEPPTDGQG